MHLLAAILQGVTPGNARALALLYQQIPAPNGNVYRVPEYFHLQLFSRKEQKWSHPLVPG